MVNPPQFEMAMTAIPSRHLAKDYLFVYGSLITGAVTRSSQRAVGQTLHRDCRVLGPAWVRGRLYALHRYPAAIPSSHRHERIHGLLLALHHPTRSWPILDGYEDYDPTLPDQGEFVRRRVPVQLASGRTHNAWIYWYHRRLDWNARLRDGRYVRHCRRRFA